MESVVADPVNERIASTVRALRTQLGLSLEALAAASGVSRSALSLIERAESSPTAVVLDRIAAGLGVPLASLFGDTHVAEPLARRDEQTVWRDPSSGYLRRSVSPGGFPTPIRIVEITFPAGASVAFDTAPGERLVQQQLWVLEGTIEVTVGDETIHLEAGDCLATRLGCPALFHNPTREDARYAVVTAVEPVSRR